MKKIFVVLLLGLVWWVNPLLASDLKGSRESLQKQNAEADKEGLVRITDDTILEEFIQSGTLTSIPQTVKIDRRLDRKWQWCLPQTSVFVEDFGIEFIDQFGHFFQVNSAVRTAVRQLEISEENGNAAPISGDRASPHLTGSTIDIAKIGLNDLELAWMREKLLEFEDKGLIEATEEELQAVFHIMVFKTYVEYSTNHE